MTRTREEIINTFKSRNETNSVRQIRVKEAILEVLLDIRDQLDEAKQERYHERERDSLREQLS